MGACCGAGDGCGGVTDRGGGMREMDDRGGGSFVAVRRISQGLERGNTCHSTSGEYNL